MTSVAISPTCTMLVRGRFAVEKSALMLLCFVSGLGFLDLSAME